jgi:hypothetical protein
MNLMKSTVFRLQVHRLELLLPEKDYCFMIIMNQLIIIWPMINLAFKFYITQYFARTSLLTQNVLKFGMPLLEHC